MRGCLCNCYSRARVNIIYRQFLNNWTAIVHHQLPHLFCAAAAANGVFFAVFCFLFVPCAAATVTGGSASKSVLQFHTACEIFSLFMGEITTRKASNLRIARCYYVRGKYLHCFGYVLKSLSFAYKLPEPWETDFDFWPC